MKSFLLLLLVSLFVSFNVSAQFDVASGTITGNEITIEGENYTISITDKGSEYIICNSPTSGNNYPVWIGKTTDKIYQGKPLRISKSGTYFIFIVSTKSNNPYCKYIKKLSDELVSDKSKPKLG